MRCMFGGNDNMTPWSAANVLVLDELDTRSQNPGRRVVASCDRSNSNYSTLHCLSYGCRGPRNGVPSVRVS